MPTFEIGLDDGRKFRIEADSRDTAISGLQHHLGVEADAKTEAAKPPEKDTSVWGALGYGLKNAKTGAQQTYDLAVGNPIRPDADPGNYAPASPSAGFGKGFIPGVKETARFLAENAPPAVAGIGAAALAPELAIPAATAVGMGLSSGHFVKQRAENMGHETPTAGDVAAGLGTSGVSSLIGAAPITRMIPGANPITSVGVRGVLDSARKLAVTTAAEAGAGGGANLAGQVGSTIGTPGGTQVDRTQVLDNVIGTGTGALALKTPRALADASTSRAYKSVTGPENLAAATAVAERLKNAAAEGKPNKASLDAVERDIRSEVSEGAKGIEGLSQDAQNALARPSNLGKPELQALQGELKGTQEGQALMHLVRQAQMAELVRKSGTESNGKLIGGAGAAIERLVPHPLRKAAYGALGSHFVPGIGFIGQGVSAALAGSYLGARGLDLVTGARNPVARFQKRFEAPGAQARLALQTAPAPSTEAPEAPWGPRPVQTVPSVPLGGQVDPQAAQKAQIRDAMDLMAARQANDRLRSKAAQSGRSALREQMTDAVAQMAARRANAPPEEKALDPVKQQIAEATMLMAARKANADQQAREAQDLMRARVANGAPTPMQRAQMADARELTAARRANEPDEPVAPVEPKVTKVSKANGKTQHTVEQPPMAEALFQPKSGPAELPYYGQEHAEVADHKLANRPDYKDLSKERKSIIREGIIKGRMADEAHLRPLVHELPNVADRATLVHLIEELHHTSSRQRAREVRDYYASKLPANIAARVKTALSDAYINKSKRKD